MKMNLKEIIMILIISIILLFIISPDVAEENLMDNTITSNFSKTLDLSGLNISNTSEIIFIDENNNAYVRNESYITPSSSDIVIEKKPQKPIITITARPSCGCRYSYKWRTNSFINYCPHCRHYGVLYNAYKWQAKHEQELTCKRCGADYCGQCGKEKYSWSRYYLRKY